MKLLEEEKQELLYKLKHISQFRLYLYTLSRIYKEKDSLRMSELESYAEFILKSELLSHAGGYAQAFEHAKRSYYLDSTNYFKKKQLLFYYTCPDNLLSFEEAVLIAKELYLDNQNDITVNMILEKDSC